MKLLTVDTIGEALEKIHTRVKAWRLETETILLGETASGGYFPDGIADKGAGRVLAEDIYARGDIPAFRRAVVDGYAVIAADTAGAGDAIPAFLKMVGAARMGKPAGFSIRSGECAYVPTGGMIPAGADAVVMAEYAEVSGDGVAVYEAAAPGRGIAEAGEDLHAGELIARRGTVIRPQEIGACAAAGISSVRVFAPLCLAVISTGDELVPPEQEPQPGEVRDINTRALTALAMRRGYRVVCAKVIPDNEAAIEAAVRKALPLCDIVIISGGSSKGEKDFTAGIIDRVTDGGVFSGGLAVKPGKPAIFGWDAENKTLLAGLPGHPVSAMMVFEIILGRLIDELFGCVRRTFPVTARISCNVPGASGKTLLLPVILRMDETGYLAEPVFGKSGMITTLTRADGYAVIDLNKEGLRKDEPVLVHLL